MNPTDDTLILALQQEFYTDPDGVLDNFFECLLSFRTNPSLTITEMCKLVHSLKGTAQAIGLTTFAAEIIFLEQILTDTIKKIEANTNINEQAILRLENLLAGVVRSLEEYFSLMRTQNGNCNTESNKQHQALIELQNWNTNTDDSDWGMATSVLPELPTNIEPPIKTEPARVSSKNDSIISTESTITKTISSDIEITEDIFIRHLLINKKGRVFAVNLNDIVEILECRIWCSLPIKRLGILGVMNRIGEVLPVLDLGYAVGIGSENIDNTSNNAHRSIIVCSANNKRFGFPVDSVTQIIDINKKLKQSVSDIDFSEHKGVVSEMAIINNSTIFFVNLKTLLEQVSI